ncbi:hypothetical protein [Chitinophaga caseinilytica]|uniref:Uncharacterized protein n=1 Tax=Chitinophaga caseinilytica TaxID=2267521 RepID=A0ABZ2Z4H0_9BACT
MDHTVYIRWAHNAFELMACVTGFVYWRKLRGTYWQWFPVYLALILAMELGGKYLRDVLGHVDWNFILFRYVCIPLQFLFYCWLFRQYFKGTPVRGLPLLAAAVYVLSFGADVALVQPGRFWFFSFSYTVGNLVLLVLIFTYFIRLVRDEEALQFKTSLMFWVCFGLLLFYLGTMPFYGLHNTLRMKYPAIFMVYWYIQITLSALMYSSFTLGFIWSRQK